MSKINYYIKKARSMPLHILTFKIYNKIETKISNTIQRKKDLNGNTHIDFDMPFIKNNYIDINDLDVSNIDKEVAGYISKMYIDHRFDLLGSGWVKNSYDSIPLGVEGYKYNKNVFKPQSISNEYEPIDWQKDFKSGYRWSEKNWYKEQRHAVSLGVDIKVPWELSRFQHLPQLALFSLLDNNLLKKNIQEFKYQILDFIDNNPPRMGVNWVCTMDVGIRVSNMLVAYDMFIQMDDNNLLDKKFKQQFANSVYEHGLHIVNNLEYSESLTSNHYLSDIAGLLFVSAYIEESETGEVSQWLAFSIQEIISEMEKEFYEDGGNFESSTNYHRLSGELMAFSVALIAGLKEKKVESLKNYNVRGWKVNPKLLSLDRQQFEVKNKVVFPQWFIDRLYKIGRFTVDITKPNGEIPQIGDNDSGRFFRLSPNGKFLGNKEAEKKYENLKGYNKHINTYTQKNELFWDENILNHNTFISVINGLFEDDIFKTDKLLEKSFISVLAKTKLSSVDIKYKQPILSNVNHENLRFHDKKEYKSILSFNNPRVIFYADSGIYIVKSDTLHMTICATPVGQKGNGGHDHNDKLSYELWFDSKSVARDPGTYLYTSLPHRRNEFRSVIAHNTMIVKGEEQNNIDLSKLGLFTLFERTKCSVIDIQSNVISLKLEYKDIVQVRNIEILDSQIIINDSSNKSFEYVKFKYYSNGYGKLICI